METAEIESRVYTAFTESEPLTSLLADGADSVFHLEAPGDDYSRYPIIVYTPISDVPALSGDNEEQTHRVTIRVHMITEDGSYPAIYREIYRLMADLGFYRVQTTPFVEDGKKMLIADFRIGVDSTWQQ